MLRRSGTYYGRDAQGHKLRWSSRQKRLAREAYFGRVRARAEKSKRARLSNVESLEQDRIRGEYRSGDRRVSLLVELPPELLERIFFLLPEQDELVARTCSKVLLSRRKNMRRVVDLRNFFYQEFLRKMDTDRIQRARKKLDYEMTYLDRMTTAVAYYQEHHDRLRTPGVNYKMVAKKFDVVLWELKEEYEHAELDAVGWFDSPSE